MSDEVPKVSHFAEIGNTGLNRYGQSVYEEFLPALRWPKAAKVFEEMSSNDPTIGAVLFAAEQLIRRVSWRVEPGGITTADIEAAAFVEECREDMEESWIDLITEILSMLVHGWSWHEIVYKRRLGDNMDVSKRSQYNDGKIGWAKMPIRAQTTLNGWIFNDSGYVIAMDQNSPPNYQTVIIPRAKSLLFRTKSHKGNPEGKSMLRNAYRPWFFKKRIEEIEGIGIERDLAGLPMLTPPEGLNIWDVTDPEMVSMKNEATKLVTNIRRDQNEGVVLPFGWDLKLLSTGSRRQFDTNAILNRYDQRIAITVLADMVLLGADKVGSFALAEVKKSLFAGALEAWTDAICAVFNREAIPALMKLNGFVGLTANPKLTHGEIESPSLKELGDYIGVLAGLGFNLVDDKVESYLREVASLPQKAAADPNAPEPTPDPNAVPDPTPGKGGNPNGRERKPLPSF
jgi:hypothetical protein